MSISCLTGGLLTRAEQLKDSGLSETQAVAQAINEEYRDITESFNSFKPGDANPVTNLLTLPEPKAPEQILEESTKLPNEPFVELGNTKNEDGEYISDILSELLTMYVDAPNKNYIPDLNAVTAAANTMLMMVRQGISLRKIFLFITQPIIKDYLEAEANLSSLTINRPVSRAEIAEMIFKKYKPGYNIAESIWYTEHKLETNPYWAGGKSKGKIYSDFTLKELREGVSTGGANKAAQIKALDVFLEYRRQSGKLQDMVRSTSPDTQGFKTFSMLESQLALREQINKEGFFGNYEKIFEDTFIGAFCPG